MNITNQLKRPYVPPLVMQAACIQLERDFLKASLVDTVVVESVGQMVEEQDFSSTDFNHQWE